MFLVQWENVQKHPMVVLALLSRKQRIQIGILAWLEVIVFDCSAFSKIKITSKAKSQKYWLIFFSFFFLLKNICLVISVWEQYVNIINLVLRYKIIRGLLTNQALYGRALQVSFMVYLSKNKVFCDVFSISTPFFNYLDLLECNYHFKTLKNIFSIYDLLKSFYLL